MFGARKSSASRTIGIEQEVRSPSDFRDDSERFGRPPLRKRADSCFQSSPGWSNVIPGSSSWPGSAVTFLLFRYAPPWDQVTKDDDVRFFPRDFPSVIGQDLLERGFPQDAASSQLVIVYERADGPLDPGRLRRGRGAGRRAFTSSARPNPSSGVKKMDTHRSPVIGPRLIGKSAEGPGQAVLTIVSLRGHLSFQEDPGRGRPRSSSTWTRAAPCPRACGGW